MLREVTEILEVVPSGVFLDATLGGGGHAASLLEHRSDLKLVGLDQDPAAIEISRQRVPSDSLLCHSSFNPLNEVLSRLGVEEIAGVLFDLGVSSMQIDDPSRGFSYMRRGPIDMRMDPGNPINAAEIVNTWDHNLLVELLRLYGDERYADRIAESIVAARPITDTLELAEVIVKALPPAARRRGGHPAKRSFQALRIAVNKELEVLSPALREAINRLQPSGRGVVLSYHSGEDRVVKDVLRSLAGRGCRCPSGLPCVCGSSPKISLSPSDPLRPTPEEKSRNPRSASARLRSFQKLPVVSI